MFDQSLKWISSGSTHPGKVRPINEDAFLDCPDKGMWVVADGMGGHDAGDYASQLIVARLENLAPQTEIHAYVELVQDELWEVNRDLLEEGRLRGGVTIGSTVAVFLVAGEQCACLWVGDSRIYRLRRHSLEQITKDHSETQELIDQHLILPEDAENHPRSNIITRAIGVADSLLVDVRFDIPNVGDAYLLCSDGLNKELDEKTIEKTFDAQESSDVLAKNLVDAALAKGARDNTTVGIVQFL